MYQKSAIFVCLMLTLIICTTLEAQKPPRDKGTAAEQIARATKNINNKQLYDLSYKLKKGDELRWVVEHTAETTYSQAGSTEESTSRCSSVKLWKVANVDSLGQMTFVYSIESLDMWQQNDELDPIKYNSKTDTEIPDTYKIIADRVGKPHAIFTITPAGKVINRQSSFKEDKFGVGKVATPLPGKPVPVGYKWDTAAILQANDTNKVNRRIKARVVYELAKVKGHNAFIKFRTEILTPNISEKIRSTIMQQMTDGYIVFDLESGYQILKRVEWDEKAQGFEGSDSYLKYVGRMSEKFITPDAKPQSTASALAPIQNAVASKPTELKTRDSAPVMRK